VQIRKLLRHRAKERSASLRCNTNTLIVAYLILTVTMILTLSAVNVGIVAVVAAVGLAIIWTFSHLQSRKLEAQFLEEEMRAYSDLLHSQPSRDAPANWASDKLLACPLAPRELEVLKQIAQGHSYKEAASALSISDFTVKNHISHIFAKLDVRDRTSAVLLAIRHGWIGSSVDHSGPTTR